MPRKTYKMQFDAFSSPLSNDENRSSLSCFYEKLFKPHSIIVPYHGKTGLIETLLL
jgi:hypothetical protein